MPGAGRQQGQKSAPGIVHLRRPQQARDSVEEQSHHPAGPRWRASGVVDTVRRPPARPPFPPISTCGTGAVTKKICCFVGKGAVGGDGACAALPQLSEVGEGT